MTAGALKYKDEPAMKPLSLFVLVLTLFGLSACGPVPRNSQIIQPKFLFSLDYGLQDRMLGLPEGRAGEVEVYMREGIFHILDPVLKKILRTSSYGDLLSSIYDSETTPSPSFGMTYDRPAKETGAGTLLNEGRYAVRTIFFLPSRLSVDSAQKIYLADRLDDQDSGAFDPLTGSYGGWIIRRFGENGRELPYLGREGSRGSAFPRILRTDCLSDDSIVVVSTSGSFYTVYRYSSDARLLSSFGIDTAALPIPLELVDSNKNSGSTGKIRADVENLIPMKTASGFSVILKLNYYRETSDPATLINTGLENAGSWIFSMDGTTGSQNFGFQLELSENAGEEEEWDFLGVHGDNFLLSSPQRQPGGKLGDKTSGQSRGEESRALRLVDPSGKALGACEIRIPAGAGLLKSLRVSSTAQLYGILLGRDEAKILWWELPF